MKIRLDDVMQSLSYPFHAVYYYFIPLETVLMFMGGRIYGKAVYGISTEEDLLKRSGEYIKLPEIGEEGRIKVMKAFVGTIPGSDWFEELKDLDPSEENKENYDMIIKERNDIALQLYVNYCEYSGFERSISSIESSGDYMAKADNEWLEATLQEIVDLFSGD